MDKIRIGTRGSRLALRQAALVQEAFAKVGVEIETEIVILHTKGDKVLEFLSQNLNRRCLKDKLILQCILPRIFRWRLPKG